MLTDLFTTHLKNAFAKSITFCNEFGHEQLTPEHLLYGLSSERGSLSYELLQKVEFPIDLLKQDLIRRFHTPYVRDQKMPDLHDDVINILAIAYRIAQKHEHSYLGTEHVLDALTYSMETELKELFRLWGISLDQVQKNLQVVLKSTSKFPDIAHSLSHTEISPEFISEEKSEFPILESIATELTNPKKVKKMIPLIGRDEELQRVEQILGRKLKNNPLLVGPAGVGKTAVVEGLAQAIVQKNVSPSLLSKRIFAIEASSLVAGTMYRGDFELRMKGLIEELKDHPEIILFIDEIHTLMGAGSTGQAMDAANILKPSLARGEIRCIGATTWDEFQKHLSQDQALMRRFQHVSIEEPSREETAKILDGIKTRFEEFHEVNIPTEVIDSVLDLSERYLTHTSWPDKAIDVIDEAASFHKMKQPAPKPNKNLEKLKQEIRELEADKKLALNQGKFELAIELHDNLKELIEKLKKTKKRKKKRPIMSIDHIQQAVSSRTGIKINQLQFESSPIEEHLVSELTSEIIGQDEAIKKLAKVLQRSHSFLKEPQKPHGAFLFLGPSGVGKTATAKSLAKAMFGNEKSLIRIDMSEYAQPFTTSKLIGAPAGYVGYQQSGVLSSAIKQRPLSVVLFDEVEKAHPDIFHLLLQILDEGQLIDGGGQVVDFRHSVIILTSNLGLDRLESQLGFAAGKNSPDQEFTGAAKEFFRTEFLNRLDEIIGFQHLGEEHRQAIIKKAFLELEQRLRQRFSFDIHEDVITFLANNNYKQQQGVRSIQKNIKKHIEHPLSQELQRFSKGDTIKIRLSENRVVLK